MTGTILRIEFWEGRAGFALRSRRQSTGVSSILLGVRPLPKLGDCSRCARPAGTLAAEQYVLAGGAGQNMISFSFPACGRGNSARRALPGEGRWTERWVRAFVFFAGCRPDLLALPGESVGRLGAWEPMGFCGLLPGPAAFPGQAMGRKGGWIPLRRRPTPKVSRADIEGDERGRERGLSPFCLRMGAQRLPLPGVRWAGPLPLSRCDNRTNACSFGGLFLKKREKTSHIS